MHIIYITTRSMHIIICIVLCIRFTVRILLASTSYTLSSGRGTGHSAAFAHFRHSLPREQLNPPPVRREACRGQVG